MSIPSSGSSTWCSASTTSSRVAMETERSSDAPARGTRRALRTSSSSSVVARSRLVLSITGTPSRRARSTISSWSSADLGEARRGTCRAPREPPVDTVADDEVAAVLLDALDVQDGVDEERALDRGRDEARHEVDALDRHRPALGHRALDRGLDADEHAARLLEEPVDRSARRRRRPRSSRRGRTASREGGKYARIVWRMKSVDVTRVIPSRWAVSVATVDLPVPVAPPTSRTIGRSRDWSDGEPAQVRDDARPSGSPSTSAATSSSRSSSTARAPVGTRSSSSWLAIT